MSRRINRKDDELLELDPPETDYNTYCYYLMRNSDTKDYLKIWSSWNLKKMKTFPDDYFVLRKSDESFKIVYAIKDPNDASLRIDNEITTITWSIEEARIHLPLSKSSYIYGRNENYSWAIQVWKYARDAFSSELPRHGYLKNWIITKEDHVMRLGTAFTDVLFTGFPAKRKYDQLLE